MVFSGIALNPNWRPMVNDAGVLVPCGGAANVGTTKMAVNSKGATRCADFMTDLLGRVFGPGVDFRA